MKQRGVKFCSDDSVLSGTAAVAGIAGLSAVAEVVMSTELMLAITETKATAAGKTRARPKPPIMLAIELSELP
jgi:hypothetical protein